MSVASLLLSLLLSFVAFNGLAGTPYRVVDLSGGPEAKEYPVSDLADVPAGGWTDEYKTTKLVLRRLEAGTFEMGSPTNEVGRCADEPCHTVTLTKGFDIGVFELTQRQWELVMGTRPSHFADKKLYATRPVENVSYTMARGKNAGTRYPASDAVDKDSFLGILRAKTKLTFDLPTEAQWEYACRAGTASGEANLSAGRHFANGGDEEQRGGGTAPVGSYAPNAWGLYDLRGNVCEWCLDWWTDVPAGATDPKGPAKGPGRVCRGSCWVTKDAGFCRSAARAYYPPTGGYYLGLRLVVNPTR